MASLADVNGVYLLSIRMDHGFSTRGAKGERWSPYLIRVGADRSRRGPSTSRPGTRRCPKSGACKKQPGRFGRDDSLVLVSGARQEFLCDWSSRRHCDWRKVIYVEIYFLKAESSPCTPWLRGSCAGNTLATMSQY